jgi:uncharacterized protein with PQ loop repeat
MNVTKLKQKLIMTIIGVSILALWVVYAIVTNFNFYDFITNPVFVTVALILVVPLSFVIADVLWGSK